MWEKRGELQISVQDCNIWLKIALVTGNRNIWGGGYFQNRKQEIFLELKNIWLPSKITEQWMRNNSTEAYLGFSGGSDDNLSAVQETRVQSLGQEDPLEKGMTTHSSILA